MTQPGKTRFERHEPLEIAALRRIKREQPDLAVAVDLQIDIVVLQRRVQGRLTTPWIDRSAESLAQDLAGGRPALRFGDVAFDWVELRVLFRQVADVLARHDTIEASDHAGLVALARTSRPSPTEVQQWFEIPAGRQTRELPSEPADGGLFAQVLQLSAQPFLERAAEAIRSRLDPSAWDRPYCPYCSAEPEMASLQPDGGRRLHCGRCNSSWHFEAATCPFCGSRHLNDQIDFVSSDPRYRLLACAACRRYLKAVDVRRAERGLILTVDSIATLPLDAAAARQGFVT